MGFATVIQGKYIQAQGRLVECHADGTVTIHVGSRAITGLPVGAMIATAPAALQAV